MGGVKVSRRVRVELRATERSEPRASWRGSGALGEVKVGVTVRYEAQNHPEERVEWQFWQNQN